MVSSANSDPIVPNFYLEVAPDATDQEGQRLKTMKDLVGVVARQDLAPLFAEITESSLDGPAELIDLGAGPDRDIEIYCRENNIGYTAYDGNEAFLADRRISAEQQGQIVDISRLKLGRLEDMSDIPDAVYDLSFSRAATAWSSDPDKTIAEQLRITGKTAVFTEYDWTHAGVHGVDNDAVAAGNAAKAAMVLVLESAKFQTELGAVLSERVANVAARAGFTIAQSSFRHELPEADHRALFLDAAETILGQLRMAGDGVAMAKARAIAERLDKYLRIVRDAPQGSITFRLPALATEIVRITARPEQA